MALVAGALSTALSSWAAGATASTIIGRMMLSVALSALQTALQKQGQKRSYPGLKTDYTTDGGTNPQAFVLGWYATDGHMVCPPMSHGSTSKTPNIYLTYVISLGNVPGAQIDKVIIDDKEVSFAAAEETGLVGGPIPAGRPDWWYQQQGMAPANPAAGLPTVTRGRPATTTKYAGWAWLRYHDGRDTTPDPYLMQSYGPGTGWANDSGRPWTADMVGLGTCYAVVTFRFHKEEYTGLPKVRFVLRGLPLYDPRKDTTAGGSGPQRWADPATWAPTTNGLVIAYNILRGIPIAGGPLWGYGASADALPLASWGPAMTAADQTVDGAPRWQAGCEVAVDEQPADVLDEVLKVCAAQVAEVGGVWKIRVGPPAAPVLWISDDDILLDNEASLNAFPGLEATFNGVQASYPEPSALWRPKDAPARYNASWEAADAGRRLVADLNLPACPWGPQVQRVMRAYIEEERRFRRHVISLPPIAEALEPLDVIAWTSAENGYDAKLFEVAEIAEDPQSLRITLSLREVDPADYDWQPDFLLPSTVPPIGTPDPAPVTASYFTAEGIALQDAAGRPRRPAARLRWGGWGLDGISAVAWELRRAGSQETQRGLSPDPEAGELHVTAGVLPATAYEARIVFQTETRVPVSWTAWQGFTTPDTRLTGEDIGEGVIGLFHVDRSIVDAIDAASGSAAGDVAAAEAARDAAAAAQGNAQTAAALAAQAQADAAAASTAAAGARDQAVDANAGAQAAKTASESARDQARTATGEATAAKDAAAASSTTAGKARDAATAARDAAAGSATTAAGSATTAAQKADAAAGSASAAAGSATSAATKAGEASTSAGQAASSATNAAGSANSASTAAATVAQTYRDAIRLIGNGDFRHGAVGWSSGAAGTDGTLPAGVAVIAGGYTSNAALQNSVSTSRVAYLLSDIPITPARVYRATVRARNTGTVASNYVLRAGYKPADRASTLVTRWALRGQLAAGSDWQEFTALITGEGSSNATFAAGTRWAQLSINLNSGNVAGAVIEVDEVRWDDVTDAKAAADSAAAAATSATSAAASETAAGQSASAAAGSATTAATRAGEASTSASQAASSRTDAAGSASSAANSASAAATSASTAGDKATAAATSASTAATKATEAGQSASTATTAANTAATKAGEASTSATQAAQSKTDAAGSASSASTSAGAAAGSANTAGDKATAAATSASTAATKATEASQSATTASTAATTAATKAGEAGTSATNAASSAATAAGSENSASMSATVAARNAARTLPPEIGDGSFWEGLSGVPLTAGILTVPAGLTTSKYATSLGGVPLVPGRSYRVTAKVRQRGGISGSTRLRGYWRVRDAARAIVSSGAFGSLVPATGDDSWQFVTATVTAPSAAGVTIHFGLTVGGSIKPAFDIDVESLLIEDISESMAAAGFSATASTKATEATQSATAAAGSATTAATKAGEASTFATQASQSKTDAAGSASSAATSAGAAAGSANTAGEKATAAATSASTAATKATEASQSASTATTASNTATTRAGEAGVSATQAASSATTARDQAGIATNASSAAAGSAVAAQSSALRTLPSEVGDGQFFTLAWGGAPESVASLASSASVTLNADGTMTLPASVTTGTPAYLAKGVLRYVPGRTYRVTISVQSVGGVPGAGRLKGRVQRLDGSYTSVDGVHFGDLTPTASGTWQTRAAIFTADPSSSTEWARFGIALGGAVTPRKEIRVRSILIEDISESTAAGASASAAATSASTAATKASEAGNSATAAQSSQVAAATKANEAATAAGAAGNRAGEAANSAASADASRIAAAHSASDAAGSSAQAYAASQVAARTMSGGISVNPVFTDWPAGQPAPTGYRIDGLAASPTASVGRSQSAVLDKYNPNTPVINSGAGPTGDGPRLYLRSTDNPRAADNPAAVCITAELMLTTQNTAQGAILQAQWVGNNVRTVNYPLTGRLPFMRQTAVGITVERPAGFEPGTAPQFNVSVFATSDIGPNGPVERASNTIAVHRLDYQHVTDTSSVVEWQRAKVSLEGIKSAAYGLRVKAGDAQGSLELVALDDPVAGAASAFRVAADLILLDGSIGPAKFKDVLQSDNFVGGAGGQGWQIRRNGTAEFNNVTIRRQLAVDSGSVTVPGITAGGANNAYPVITYADGPRKTLVVETSIPISAWSGTSKTYLAVGGMSGATMTIDSIASGNELWGWVGEVLPLTKWSGAQVLRIGFKLYVHNATFKSLSQHTLNWKLYEVS